MTVFLIIIVCGCLDLLFGSAKWQSQQLSSFARVTKCLPNSLMLKETIFSSIKSMILFVIFN